MMHAFAHVYHSMHLKFTERQMQEVQGKEYSWYIHAICGFKQPFTEKAVFGHLRWHLRTHEIVACAYKNCAISTNVYSSFNSDKSRSYDVGAVADLFDDVSADDNFRPKCCGTS